jgi:hypothetical protein
MLKVWNERLVDFQQMWCNEYYMLQPEFEQRELMSIREGLEVQEKLDSLKKEYATLKEWLDEITFLVASASPEEINSSLSRFSELLTAFCGHVDSVLQEPRTRNYFRLIWVRNGLLDELETSIKQLRTGAYQRRDMQEADRSEVLVSLLRAEHLLDRPYGLKQ